MQWSNIYKYADETTTLFESLSEACNGMVDVNKCSNLSFIFTPELANTRADGKKSLKKKNQQKNGRLTPKCSNKICLGAVLSQCKFNFLVLKKRKIPCISLVLTVISREFPGLHEVISRYYSDVSVF